MELNDLLNIINEQEVIIIQDTTGHILIDNHDAELWELVNNDYYSMWLDDNYTRTVLDITVVKQDLSLDNATLLITIE